MPSLDYNHSKKAIMKKILALLVLLIFSFYSLAQDRVDSDGVKLFYKSQELKKAKFWQKNEAIGKWESSKSNALDYGGLGDKNFLSIYFGMVEYMGEQKVILYRLFWKGRYKYPNLKMDWMSYKTIEASIVSEEQYNSLKNIQPSETIQLTSFCIEEKWIGSLAYNEDEFLYTLLSKLAKTSGKKQVIAILLAKRTTSNGNDVVRFKFGWGEILGYPTISDIDNSYFEVPYKEFLKLFTKGKL